MPENEGEIHIANVEKSPVDLVSQKIIEKLNGAENTTYTVFQAFADYVDLIDMQSKYDSSATLMGGYGILEAARLAAIEETIRKRKNGTPGFEKYPKEYTEFEKLGNELRDTGFKDYTKFDRPTQDMRFAEKLGNIKINALNKLS